MRTTRDARNNDALSEALGTIAGAGMIRGGRLVAYTLAERSVTPNTLARTARGRRWQRARAILARGVHVYLP